MPADADQPLQSCALFQVAEQIGAGFRDGGVDGAAAGHRRPAALLDEGALLIRADLLQFGHVHGRLGAVLESVHADRRQRRHEGGLRASRSHVVRGAAGDPAAPVESDDQRRDGAESRALEQALEDGLTGNEVHLTGKAYLAVKKKLREQ